VAAGGDERLRELPHWTGETRGTRADPDRPAWVRDRWQSRVRRL